MLRALFSRLITTMERRWNYDASYMREVLEVSSWAFFRFGFVASLGNGRRAPGAALAAAGLSGTLAEDCGPCTQIGIDMALAGGVPAETLRAIVSGDEAAMGPDAALAWRFARSVLARDIERADPLREEILRRWGKGALVDIGLRLTTARMYPTLKYALGHGRACSRVMVGDQATIPVRPLELAA